jgi:hypothetical protein
MKTRRMHTEDLIAALTADIDAKPAPLGPTLALDAGAGFAVAAIGFFLVLGLRSSFFESLDQPRFLFKFLFSGSMAVTGLLMAWRLARPEAVSARVMTWALLAPALAFLACCAEMATVPSALWMRKMVGDHALQCLVSVPALAAAPLAGLFAFLRHAAPADPNRAGAAAAFAACGLGAMLYAGHCPEDSPFFVAVWYLLATAATVAAGWFAGGRFLRW